MADNPVVAYMIKYEHAPDWNMRNPHWSKTYIVRKYKADILYEAQLLSPLSGVRNVSAPSPLYRRPTDG